MDAINSFSTRLKLTRSVLGICFAIGFSIPLWDPHPRLILTIVISITAGILFLGPYAAAALYSLGLQQIFNGHLRWPLCVIMVLSSVYLLSYFLNSKDTQFALASFSALLGTVLGHDATLAVLKLRGSTGFDGWMVLVFPLLIGLSVLGGYTSFGFAAGSYKFALALLR